jgi:DNA-binding NarL/FixJ family response regulator
MLRMQPVNVAIEAADTFTAAGLENGLAARPEIRVVPRARLTGRAVLVVAVDQHAPQVTALLGEPRLRKVLVADFLTEQELRAATACRVVAVLSRAEAAGERFGAELLAAADGDGTMPSEAFDRLLDRARGANPAPAPRLSEREVEVLRLMADGWDTADMANRLCYSERTVKNVIYALTSRLELRSRPHAVAFAVRAGLI